MPALNQLYIPLTLAMRGVLESPGLLGLTLGLRWRCGFGLVGVGSFSYHSFNRWCVRTSMDDGWMVCTLYGMTSSVQL